MTVQQPLNANAAASHFLPDDFRAYAHRELEHTTPWARGICFLPQCGRSFTPARDWQIYCCDACKRAGNAEMRLWGNRLALSVLVHRMGKYEADDAGLRALSNAARRHIGLVQSAWLLDRHGRALGDRDGV